jgi:hypothetical protein
MSHLNALRRTMIGAEVWHPKVVMPPRRQRSQHREALMALESLGLGATLESAPQHINSYRYGRPPSWHAGGPFLFSIFRVVYAIFECDFSTQNFIIGPNLHQNAASAKITYSF